MIVIWRWMIYTIFAGVVMGSLAPDRLITALLLGGLVAYLTPRDERGRGWNKRYLVAFGLRLFWEILLANLSVAKRLLSPDPKVDPVMTTFETRLQDPRLIALLGNAITLTPGTMTVAITGGQLTVHGLSPEDVEALSGHPLERLLEKVEGRKTR
jgi:multisubunit Na+/H+ antiporter MnhE subunit